MHIFDEYLNDTDQEKRERANLWRASIGLQTVDNLRVSNFLIDTARKHIEGEISMDEVSRMINEHYKKPKESQFSILLNKKNPTHIKFRTEPMQLTHSFSLIKLLSSLSIKVRMNNDVTFERPNVSIALMVEHKIMDMRAYRF